MRQDKFPLSVPQASHKNLNAVVYTNLKGPL